ncbi:MAG: hypothetical protein J5590_03585 [Clostridia bacterium]|nr:hypothetical protein [Clostridia bacterium]
MRLKNEYLRRGAVIFTILYSIMPVVSRAVSTYLTTYFYMLFVVVFLVIIVGKRKKDSLFIYLSDILPFILFGLISYFINADPVLFWGYKVMLFIMPVVIGIYLVYYYPNDNGLYSKVIIAATLITLLTTMRGLGIYPTASRWLATADATDDAKLIKYSWMNIGGYNFVYTVVLLYPLLILAYKKGKISLFKTVVISVVIFNFLMLAEYTIALILFVVTTSMFFMRRKMKSRDITVLVIATLLIIFMFSGMVSNILKNVSAVIKSENVSERVEALSEGREGLEEFSDNRWKLYEQSLKTFFKKPLLGTLLEGGKGTSGHSFILDSVAQYGLAGILLLFFMYRKIFRMFYRKYHSEYDYGYVVWIFAQAVVLATINTGMWLEVLAFYAPVVLQTIYGGGHANEKNIVDSKYIADADQH